MSKLSTGIGYILMILGMLIAIAGGYAQSEYTTLGGGIIVIIGFLLVNIGFIAMGRKHHKGAWTATGVVGLLVFILAIAAAAVAAGAIISAMSEITTEGPSEALTSALAGAAGLVGVAGVLLFVWIIMEIIVLWSAAGYFGSGVLKGAAILKIIVLILSLIAVPALIIGAGMSAPSEETSGAMAMGLTAVAILGLDGLLTIVALILAGIGFLTAKEPTTYAAPAYGTQVAPPPPPA